MKIETASYFGSFVDVEKCPKEIVPEYAFIGRSNVGKSSLINYLTEKKADAKVSGSPGKTRTINYFAINTNKWYLVDLPGYGYARTSKSTREDWDKFIRTYLRKRGQLINLFVLVDTRIPPQKIDLEFIEWLGEHQIAFSIVFTKNDKPKSLNNLNNRKAFENELLKSWEELPNIFLTSSASNLGRAEILAFIDQCNQTIPQQ
ncbi:MAG: YihA family ribosome biogenesis GTP-binding protein [Chitinophagales bacterium]|nr:YihA family ribosome biogenesis GTP-binding protein [Chitinophagales bacterium]